MWIYSLLTIYLILFSFWNFSLYMLKRRVLTISDTDIFKANILILLIIFDIGVQIKLKTIFKIKAATLNLLFSYNWEKIQVKAEWDIVILISLKI